MKLRILLVFSFLLIVGCASNEHSQSRSSHDHYFGVEPGMIK